MVDPKLETPPLPAATGTLGQKPLAHLLIYAREKQLTGTLELRAPATEKAETVLVALSAGKMTKVETSPPVLYLGQVLSELGFVDDALLARSLGEIVATRRLHGSHLLDLRAITHEQLHEALRHLRTRKLLYAFGLPEETSFAFYNRIDLVADRPHDVEPADLLPTVWRAMRERPPLPHVRAALDKVGGHALRVGTDTSLDALGLTDAERAAAECLRLKALGVGELGAAGFLSPAAAEVLAYFLLVTKHAEVVLRSDVPPPQQAVSTIPPRAATFGSGQYEKPVSFNMRAAPPSDPAVARAIQSTMPPRAASSVPPSQKVAVASSAPPKATPGSTLPPRTPTPSSTAAPQAEQVRRNTIVERARSLDKEDFYRVLMVDRGASPEEVREAFFRLSKIWSPDTLPPSLSDVRRECTRVFAKMTAAFETLTDPDRRRRYEEQIFARAKDAAEADGLFQQAEMNLVLGDRAKAEQLVRRALVFFPDRPEYLALIAWVEANDPRRKSEEFARGKIVQLDMAIGRDPECRRAHYYRAELYKRLEDHEHAIRDYRRALEVDPDDADAERELRQYERKLRDGTLVLRSISPPRGTARPEGLKHSSGLFEKLRRK